MTMQWRAALYLSLCCGVAMTTLAADLDAGLDAVRRKDYEAAFAEFRPLAEQGEADAQVNLGNLFMRGWGVKQDYATAFDWYQKAANQNHPIAQGKLGMLHYYGLGTVQDSEAAAKWFRLAADHGVSAAQSVLGNLYAQGDGVTKDLVQAFFWLTLAFEFGDQDALRVRGEIAPQMTPGEIGEALGKVDEWNRDRGIPDPGSAPEPAAAAAEPPTEAPATRSKAAAQAVRKRH
ncbi:tetratricopeptide repeat protein [Methylolobus aquaticus]